MLRLNHETILKYINDDFFVSEVSYVPMGTSDDPDGNSYTLLRLKKDGYTTFEALRLVSNFFDLTQDSVHCQGLKDEDGITDQLISVKAILSPADLDQFNSKHRHLEKGWITIVPNRYSPLPVTEKSLHGNVFNIKLRNFEEPHADKLIEFCANSPDFVCGNYYDQQRFGLPGGPYIAHKIGEAIVQGDWEAANRLYAKSGNAQLDFPGHQAEDTTIDIQNLDPRKLNFFVSAHNSLIWNQLLSKHIESEAHIHIFDGHEVSVPDQQQALPLVITSTSYKLGLDRHVASSMKTRTSCISTTVFASSKLPDDYFKGRYSVDIQSFLPAGSYATMLLRQFVLSALS